MFQGLDIAMEKPGSWSSVSFLQLHRLHEKEEEEDPMTVLHRGSTKGPRIKTLKDDHKL